MSLHETSPDGLVPKVDSPLYRHCSRQSPAHKVTANWQTLSILCLFFCDAFTQPRSSVGECLREMLVGCAAVMQNTCAERCMEAFPAENIFAAAWKAEKSADWSPGLQKLLERVAELGLPKAGTCLTQTASPRNDTCSQLDCSLPQATSKTHRASTALE